MILLIDGTNLAFVHNSLGGLSRKDGFPTQAITGFLKSLRVYVQTFQTEKVFIAWDGGKSKKRMALHPTYKENRALEKKTPEQKMNYDELIAQLPIIKQATLDLGLYTMEGPGIEGDDLIALMAKKCNQLGQHAIIISSDSDFHQLVTPYISVYSTRNQKGHRHVTHENFSEVHDGLTPENYLQFKALQGDSSDDIPGVKGVGEKTAKKLLVEFGSVENWRSAVATGTTTPSKMLQRIIDGWDQYELSKSMIDLHNPLADFATAKIYRQEPNWANVREIALQNEIHGIYVDFGSWVRPFKELR